MSDVKDMRWTVIGKGSTPSRATFRCSCSAGTVRELSRSTVRYSGSLSCGCLRYERTLAAHTTHGAVVGGRPTPEYRVWQAIQGRCHNESDAAYQYYGARGITVCARWRGAFENFFVDVGRRPERRMSLDRIDNNGGYWCGTVACPECGPIGRQPNWRWATHIQQMNNTSRNRFLTVDGKRQTVAQWAAELGVAYTLLSSRVQDGWSDEDVVKTPTGPSGPRQELTHDNVTRSLKEWAKITGISYYTLRFRLRAGWPSHAVLYRAPRSGQG